MDVYGDTEEDFGLVKIKNSEHGFTNQNARYRKKFNMDDIKNSAMVADPLRLLNVCATSDGGAAIVVCSMDYAKRMGHQSPVKISAISTVTPTFANSVVEMPDIATDSAAAQGIEALRYRSSIPAKAYEEAGIGPEDVSVAEVYDLSSALELDWYEDLQFCPRGEGARLIRDGVTQLGGKLPVNTSGGLACFGEAVPAQALAQVCELTSQLRGQAGDRQVADAKVGITANQGLFGHGSSVIVTK
jgi:acetyl-CoA acetyltransferase